MRFLLHVFALVNKHNVLVRITYYLDSIVQSNLLFASTGGILKMGVGCFFRIVSL